MALCHNNKLDGLFGNIRPTFKVIVHINQLGARLLSASAQELDNLLLNDPRALLVDTMARNAERRTIHHHAYTNVYSSVPRCSQPCVIDHEAIADLESNLDVAGLM